MSFAHRDREFDRLLRIVAEERGIAVALVEKDYWVAHTLWALHDSGFDIWFKGGTSLSKGFHLIQRFSEDLDLRIDPGRAAGLAPLPANWNSGSRGQIRKRIAYFQSLATAIRIPDAECGIRDVAKDGGSAVYEVRYHGKFLGDLADRGLRPFVQVEAGRARVSPSVPRECASFVHEYLQQRGMADLATTHAVAARCVHPLVTLLDKLDAISKRYGRHDAPSSYVRHYEDCASIIRAEARLEGLPMAVEDLAAEMLRLGEIKRAPDAADPCFNPAAGRLAEIEQAHAAIESMFWGPRIPIAECCGLIRDWLRAKER